MDLDKIWDYMGDNPSQKIIDEVESWSQEASENRNLLEEIYCLKQLYDTVNAYENADVIAAYNKVMNRLKPNKIDWFKKKLLSPVAAVFIGFIIISSVFGLDKLTMQNHRFFTLAGEKAGLVLPDKSNIIMNSESELSYKTSLFGFNRVVNLRGEAFFSVSKRKFNCFEVLAQGIKTRVLGTEFNLRCRDEEGRVVTTLLTGSVEVEIPSVAEAIRLVPGQSITINTKNKEYVITEDAYVHDYKLWIEGKMDFKQAPLYYILSTLEKHYNVKFYYADEALKHIRFTCVLSTDNSVEQLIKVLSLTNKVVFEKQDNNSYLITDK